MSEGIVRKVDKASGKVTIAHGPLSNLKMPAMTMVFRVKDAAWLDRMASRHRARVLKLRDGRLRACARLLCTRRRSLSA